jgi:hypothetical protein
MTQFVLTISDSGRPGEPRITATCGGETVSSTPNKINGIDAIIDRLQTDLVRDSYAFRSTTETAPDYLRVPTQDVPQPVMNTFLTSVGGALFQYLFAGKIQELYLKALKESRNTGLSVTLVLRENTDDIFQVPPWITLAPWETLWDARNKMFLATGPTFFSRAVGEVVEETPRKSPLRVVIMVAAPSIYEGRRLPRLNDYVEVEKIKIATEKTQQCHVEIVPGQSYDDLQLFLYNNSSENNRFDVFHFIGHGDFDQDKHEGYLLFREADGAGGVPIYANDLRDLLTDAWGPLLVVLNSCRGAQGYGGDIFSSTATTLSVGGRIPSVIAMQFPISDRAAIEFSRALYLYLAQGATVQDSVRRARRTVKQASPEWITPVLYLRNSDYRLIVPQL